MCPAHGSEEGVSAWVWPWWRLAIQSNLVAGHQTRLYHAIQVQCRSVLDGFESSECQMWPRSMHAHFSLTKHR